MKNNLATIRDTAARCREEGLPLTECALRRLAQSGDLPACRIGKKMLLNWDNVIRFVRDGNNTNTIEPVQVGTIRRQGL